MAAAAEGAIDGAHCGEAVGVSPAVTVCVGVAVGVRPAVTVWVGEAVVVLAADGEGESVKTVPASQVQPAAANTGGRTYEHAVVVDREVSQAYLAVRMPRTHDGKGAGPPPKRSGKYCAQSDE